ESEGAKPSYGQKSFKNEISANDKVLVVSRDGRDGSISIKQDADLYISNLLSGQETNFEVRLNRGVWIQVVKGKVNINDRMVSAGDALSTEDSQLLSIKAQEDSELMIFDLA